MICTIYFKVTRCVMMTLASKETCPLNELPIMTYSMRHAPFMSVKYKKYAFIVHESCPYICIKLSIKLPLKRLQYSGQGEVQHCIAALPRLAGALYLLKSTNSWIIPTSGMDPLLFHFSSVSILGAVSLQIYGVMSMIEHG